jgi:hypothetical protein
VVVLRHGTHRFSPQAKETSAGQASGEHRHCADGLASYGTFLAAISRLAAEDAAEGDSADVMAEIRRLAALAPANYQVEIVAAARRLGEDPSMLDLIAKSVRDERRRLKPAPRFMQWARGPGGKPVLQCAVYLSGGSRLSNSLKTADTRVKGPQRMRLLLSHAIAEGQLPRGVKHPAWGLYGGPIPEGSKRLLRRLAALPCVEYELQRMLDALALCEDVA